MKYAQAKPKSAYPVKPKDDDVKKKKKKALMDVLRK
jgi:hypothetical protein